MIGRSSGSVTSRKRSTPRAVDGGGVQQLLGDRLQAREQAQRDERERLPDDGDEDRHVGAGAAANQA